MYRLWRHLHLNGGCLTRARGMEWLKKCAVCGKENLFEKIQRVHGLDNIPDFSFNYRYSNPECAEYKTHKSADIRVAHFRDEEGNAYMIPLVSRICNVTNGAIIRGSKDEKPALVRGPETIHDDSIYCHCGARSPIGVSYCWNCGRKNRNVQQEPHPQLPYDIDNLRTQIQLNGQRVRSQTIDRSVAFVDELMRRGAIVEVRFCNHCGAQNEAHALRRGM